MRTLTIFISALTAYVVIVFIWGVYKEKRTKSRKKDDQDIFPFPKSTSNSK